MSSRRDAILDALFTTLSAGAGKPASLTVTRARTAGLSVDQLPAQGLYPVSEEIGARKMSSLDNRITVRRKLRVCLETRVNATGDTTDQALDPFLTWGVKAMCATAQLPGAGGPGTSPTLTHDILEVGTAWLSDEEDQVFAGARQFFDIDYTTSGTDPDAAT